MSMERPAQSISIYPAEKDREIRELRELVAHLQSQLQQVEQNNHLRLNGGDDERV